MVNLTRVARFQRVTFTSVLHDIIRLVFAGLVIASDGNTLAVRCVLFICPAGFKVSRGLHFSPAVP